MKDYMYGNADYKHFYFVFGYWPAYTMTTWPEVEKSFPQGT